MLFPDHPHGGRLDLAEKRTFSDLVTPLPSLEMFLRVPTGRDIRNWLR